MDSDYLASAMAAGDTVRIIAARTTGVVTSAQSRHSCSPTVTAALGRLLTGAALMGTALTGTERIALHVAGDGPVGALTAEALSGGRVRGYAHNPLAEVALNARGKFDVGRLIGSGSLHVSRIDDGAQPYTSAVRLVSGEVGDDLAHYFARSEQIPTIVAVGVLANSNGVVAAGGLFAQLLPGADDATLQDLETRAIALPAVSGMIRDGATPETLIDALAGGLSPRATGSCPVSFECRCSRERVVRALLSIGRASLASLIADDETTEARCDFCGERYPFSRAELREMLASGTTTA